MTINKVILVGNVGQQPEIKESKSGSKFANFSLATTESYKGKDGAKVENTEWHRLTVLSPVTADYVAKYVNKGDMLYIEGSIRTEKYTDKAGVEKYTTKIIVGGFNSALKKLPKSSNGDSKANNPDAYKNKNVDQQAQFAPLPDDDIPF